MNSDGKIGRFQIAGGDLNKIARENLAELSTSAEKVRQNLT